MYISIDYTVEDVREGDATMNYDNWQMSYIKRALKEAGHAEDAKLTGEQILAALEAYDEIEEVTQAEADELSAIVIAGLDVMSRQN
jgi:hypothetical protein